MKTNRIYMSKIVINPICIEVFEAPHTKISFILIISKSNADFFMINIYTFIYCFQYISWKNPGHKCNHDDYFLTSTRTSPDKIATNLFTHSLF